MFRREATWLAQHLDARSVDELSPVLNIGSSTRRFRQIDQPWIQEELIAPLEARGIRVIHLDFRDGDGIDIRADMLNDSDFERIKALGAKSILCCNILEHVLEPKKLADRCRDLVGPGGLMFVTVPYSYPFHRDPIDTLYRPTPAELAQLFEGARLIHGEIVDVGVSFRDKVKKHPFVLFRQVFRFPFPFLGWTKWKRSMGKLYWLFHNYEVTGAVFQVLAEAQTEPQAVGNHLRTPIH